jgi:hypothetical protein
MPHYIQNKNPHVDFGDPISQEQSRLLNFPAEIRNAIWAYATTELCPIQIRTAPSGGVGNCECDICAPGWSWSITHLNSSILAINNLAKTSRQIYQEAVPIFYNQSRFEFRNMGSFCVYLKHTRSECKNEIKEIGIDFSSPHGRWGGTSHAESENAFYELAYNFPKLKILCLDITSVPYGTMWYRNFKDTPVFTALSALRGLRALRIRQELLWQTRAYCPVRRMKKWQQNSQVHIGVDLEMLKWYEDMFAEALEIEKVLMESVTLPRIES